MEETKMSFGENLQYLRKKEEITQEQLAERMDVSRQTISKWESDSTYPEMDKILALCEMFGCSMDGLLRGIVEETDLEDKGIYDSHMNVFNKKITGSICALITGAALTSIADGFGLGDAVEILIFFSIAIAAIVLLVVTGIQHEEFVKRHQYVHVVYSQEELDMAAHKFPLRMGIGIGLILFGALLAGVGDAFKLQDEVMGGIFLLLVAAGVYFLVYGGMDRDKYDVEKYNRANNPDSEQKKRDELLGKICGCIMILAVIVFLLLGCAKNAWNVAWVTFVIGGLLCGVVAIVLGQNK